MKKPFTIKLFMPDGDAASLKIITKMNWTGVGIELSRAGWKHHRSRDELSRAGIYILVGQEEGDELPKLYIGQGDGVKNRIEDHSKKKPFWDRALIFVSSNDSLNRAHITWLEWALIERAQRIGRYNLDNSAIPNEPGLTEPEKADTQEFLDEILSILPLVEVNAFEQPKKIESAPNQTSKSDIEDTVVVPAQAEGFKKVFLGENCWYAIRIGGGRLEQIKYIAAYQTSPVSAITHIAEVASIEPYGDGKKYKLNFPKLARRFGPLQLGNAHGVILQGPRYTSLAALENAKDIGELF